MKRILNIILVFFIVSILNGCSDREIIGEEGLYAFTSDTTKFDEFAKEDVVNHILTFYGYVSDSMKLGKGITVYGKEIPTVLYPIWKNDKIIGVYNVIFYKNEYSGSYHDANASQLNFAIGKTNPDNPIRLLKIDSTSGFYYSIGDTIYSMTGQPGEVIDDFIVKFTFFKEFMQVDGSSVNVKETLEYVPITME